VKPFLESHQPSAAAAVAEPIPAAAIADAEITCGNAMIAEDTSTNDNMQDVKEYSEDIIDRLFRDEIMLCPNADYMDSQQDLNERMRTILNDWLVEVHNKYKLRPETLHLTIGLIDRYLSKVAVLRKHLQLIGVVALNLASKFEEIDPPELQDWVYITDNAYTKRQVLDMESRMLSMLGFKLTFPTAAHFFSIFAEANGCEATHWYLAQYILELSLLDLRAIKFTASQLSAGALLLSNELLNRRTLWPTTMSQCTRLSEEELALCVSMLRELFEADRAGTGGQLCAVHKKFADGKWHRVSNMSL
jgi:hypothetical protein